MATFLPSVYAFFAAAAAGCLLATVFGELRRVGTDRLTAVTLSALVATLAAAAALSRDCAVTRPPRQRGRPPDLARAVGTVQGPAAAERGAHRGRGPSYRGWKADLWG